MINLIELVNKYVEDGYNEIYANAKVAQDIILRYLFKSEYKNHITLKGGVVMYNLTQDKRRATIDIDLDLIRIYLADDNLYKIFTSHKLRGIDFYINVNEITNLKHQDYKGKRIPVIIRDTFNNEINTKIDVGVHTEYNIDQDELCFNTCIDNENITITATAKFEEKKVNANGYHEVGYRVLIENHSEQYIMVYYGQLSVDGFMVDGHGMENMGKLNPQTKAYSSLSIYVDETSSNNAVETMDDLRNIDGVIEVLQNGDGSLSYTKSDWGGAFHID